MGNTKALDVQISALRRKLREAPGKTRLLHTIRGHKTREKRNLRWPVISLTVRGSARDRQALRPVIDDVLRAGAVEESGFVLEGPVLEGPAQADGEAREGRSLEVVLELGEEAT